MTMRDKELLNRAIRAVKTLAEKAGDSFCFGLRYDDGEPNSVPKRLAEQADVDRCLELMYDDRALALLVVDLMRRVEELERLEAGREAYFRERFGPGSDRPPLL
jgi:hypothetical protein